MKRPRTLPRLLALALPALVVAAPAWAQVTVADPWARPTVPGQKVGGVYMTITAVSDSKLVAASSPAARVTEVHEMAMVDNVMKMRAVPELALPAGRAVELKPGGYHVMLIDVAKPLAIGDRVPLTLEVVDRGGKRSRVDVTAEVRSAPPGREVHKH
jgi:copper(I)-binding protein